MGPLEAEPSASSLPRASQGIISGTPHLLAAMAMQASPSPSGPHQALPPLPSKEDSSSGSSFLPFLVNEGSSGPFGGMNRRPGVNPSVALQVAPALSFVSSVGGGGMDFKRQVSYMPGGPPMRSPGSIMAMQFTNQGPPMAGGSLNPRTFQHQMSVPMSRGGGGGQLGNPPGYSNPYGDRVSNGGGQLRSSLALDKQFNQNWAVEGGS